jgi:hypothetical protein
LCEHTQNRLVERLAIAIEVLSIGV